MPLRPDWQPLEALGPPGEEVHVPLEEELSQRTRLQLEALARSAHLPQPRFGLDTPLDPLASSSTLKYVHEGELLKLRLLLDNLTLEGLGSLSVQEVSLRLSCNCHSFCLFLSLFLSLFLTLRILPLLISHVSYFNGYFILFNRLLSSFLLLCYVIIFLSSLTIHPETFEHISR